MPKLITPRFILVIIMLTFLAGSINADVPRIINYQGRLTDSVGETVADGSYQVRFKIYGSEFDNDSLWGSGPQTVHVKNGLFNYLLGSNNPISSVFFGPGSEYFLGITIGSDLELIPRTPIASTAFAWHSHTSDTAIIAQAISCYHCVSTEQIDDGCINSDKITPNAVTSGLIQNNTIIDEDISTLAEIEPEKIKGTAVTLTDDQIVEGNKTFENLNISTTTRRLALSSAAFVPQSHTVSYSRNSGYLRNTVANVTQVYYANVSLPEGATVTQFKVSFYDNESSYDALVELVKAYNPSGGEIVMASISTDDAPGFTTATNDEISSETISNDAYNYYITVSMAYSSNSLDMRFYGVEIEYTITKPLP